MKTKCKFIVLALIAMVSGMTASAQMRWGVEAGLNASHGLDTGNYRAGFNVGVTADYSFAPKWFVDASLKLSSQPSKLDVWSGWAESSSSYQQATDQTTINYTPYYLTLPVRVGYKFNVAPDIKLSVAAGPMIGCGLFGKGNYQFKPSDNVGASKISSNNVFNTDNELYFSSSRLEYGANARIGAEFFNHYTLGVEYSIMHIAGESRALDTMDAFSVNIGYKF